MPTIVKTPSGTWKSVIRKTGFPTTVKTFRLKRDAEDWARTTEDEMVRGMFVKRAPLERMTLELAMKGTGWVQAGSLEFASASLTGTRDIGEGWIVDGTLTVDCAAEVRLIPVPFNVSGMVTASFTFNNGCALQVRAKSARLALTGEARFVEDFPG